MKEYIILLNEFIDVNLGDWSYFKADEWYNKFINKYDKTWEFTDEEKDEILSELERLEAEYA